MKKIISYSMYILALIPLIIYTIITVMPNMYLSEEGRLILLLSSTILMYFGGVLLSKYNQNNKPMKRNLWIFFILYLVLVITFTLFDISWGRTGIKIKNIENIKEYINLKPFKTIKNYISYFDSLYSPRQVVLNLFGNVLAFMPMSIFLPLLFKKQNKTTIFLMTMIGIITTIELLQLFTGSGRCDIDDLILNVGGAFLLYLILKIKCINAFIRNILLLEKNKVSKFIIILFILITLICTSCIIGVIKYGEKLHNDRLDEFYSKYNYELKIIDNSTDCNTEDKIFYEDDIYKYYLKCDKKNDISIVINDKEYTLDEVLDNNFGYEITIDRLERNGLDLIKKSKYTYINIITKSVSLGNNSYTGPNIDVDTDYNLLDVITSEPGYINGDYTFKLHLIPKSKGSTNLIINYSYEDKLISYDEYVINIDDNLNVSYELNSN